MKLILSSEDDDVDEPVGEEWCDAKKRDVAEKIFLQDNENNCQE